MAWPIRNTDTHYGLVAQFFHWAVVIGIALQFVWAWRIDESESRILEYALVNQHKSIGITILALVILRLLWRAFNRPPPHPEHLKRWERLAAGVTHWGLYGLILAMPLSGWAYTAAAGYGPEFFGLVDIPALFPSNEGLEDVMHEVHETLAKVLIGLAALHILAALRHHFIVKDNVLKRMAGFWS